MQPTSESRQRIRSHVPGPLLRGVTALLVAGLTLGASTDAANGEENRSGDGSPNVVFILADDLGWAELGCYGNRFNETPQLDRMAAEGMRFTQAYAAAPVCSPYRASLMTGQWPARVGITDYLRPDDPNHLPLSQVTVAETFQQAGYATGMIGKWHLTGYEYHGAREFPPGEQGFDEVICSERRGIAGGSYFHPYHFNPAIQARLPGEFLVDRVNLEAVEFIRRHRGEPFFLYVSHYAVHTRLAGKPDLVAKYEAKPHAGHGPGAPENNPHLAAQLQSIDEGVGMILHTLAELGLDRRTLVIFTSDNGGEDRVTSNAPLRAGKSTLYEGGIREPLVIRYPGVVPPAAVCEAPVCSIDFYPTLVEAAGIQPDPRQKLDGVSLVPLWQRRVRETHHLSKGGPAGGKTGAFHAPYGLPVWKDPKGGLDRDTLYWHYPLEKPHFLGGRSAGAIRRGDWKLIEFFDTGEVELYNLADDVSEQHDLSAARPEVVEPLLAQLAAWRKDVGASRPEALPAVEVNLDGRALRFEARGGMDVSGPPWHFDGTDDYLDLPRRLAPQVAGKSIEISARVTPEGPSGVILAHGGDRNGYALYLSGGKPAVAVCTDWKRTTVTGEEKLPEGPVTLAAKIATDGRLTLSVDGRTVATGKAPGPVPGEPGDSLQIGADTIQPVGPYKGENAFAGRIGEVELEIDP